MQCRISRYSEESGNRRDGDSARILRAEVRESARTLEIVAEGLARAVEETRRLEAATVAPATLRGTRPPIDNATIFKVLRNCQILQLHPCTDPQVNLRTRESKVLAAFKNYSR